MKLMVWLFSCVAALNCIPLMASHSLEEPKFQQPPFIPISSPVSLMSDQNVPNETKMLGMMPLVMKLLTHFGHYWTSSPDKAENNDIEKDLEMRHELSEIKWDQCSSKNLRAELGTFNVKIRCEMWIPLGSNLSWYKDGQLKFFQPHQRLKGQKLLAKQDHDFDSWLSFYHNSARSKYEYHLMTLFYIDCVSEDVEGIYLLTIETPNGRTYNRTFQMKTHGNPRMASKCWWYFDPNIFSPRIIDFAKTVIGKRGEELYLPCRPEVMSSLSVKWRKTEKILNRENFSITDAGDLKIHNLTSQDGGMYSCELHHYQRDEKYDEIATYVKVID